MLVCIRAGGLVLATANLAMGSSLPLDSAAGFRVVYVIGPKSGVRGRHLPVKSVVDMIQNPETG